MTDEIYFLIALIIFFFGMYLFKKVGDGKIKFSKLDNPDEKQF